MGPLAREIQGTIGMAIEGRAPLDELSNEGGTIGHENVHGLLVAQAIARANRVGGVPRDRVVGGHCGRNTTLGESRTACAGIGFRQHEHAALGRELDGGPQPCDTAADDEEIG